MIQVTLDVRALRRLVLLLFALATVVALMMTARSAWAGVDDPPLPTVAFLARADNPVDALAAGGVAGQLGAPVFLTDATGLGTDAAAGLTKTNPDVVVLAGGLVSLTQQVHDDVAALLPDAEIIRKFGTTRTSTAVALSELASELGFVRPLLVGSTVPGDAGISGELTVDGIDVAATLKDLTARVAALESDLSTANTTIDALELDLQASDARIDTLESEVGALEATLAGVTRNGDLLTFSGMNVQIVNGQGSTATTNGLGNLLLGYDEDTNNMMDPDSDGAADIRTGSHNLVIGIDHTYSSFGGLVVGRDNAITNWYATVTGGREGTASGQYSSVSGGNNGTASGTDASVVAGINNVASGPQSFVGGGHGNDATGTYSAAVGGENNTAGGYETSVFGGLSGTVTDDYDSRVGNTDFPDLL
jgi:hypothetical protein